MLNCLLFANSIFTYGHNKFQMNCRQPAVSVSNKLVGGAVESSQRWPHLHMDNLSCFHTLQQDHTVVLAICSNQ